MKAVTQDEYGDVDVLQLSDVPDPVPGAGEVLVQVAAAGVDRGTWHVMTGLPLLARLGLGLRRPRVRTPGRDVAGVVRAVGPQVTDFGVGDVVFGSTGGTASGSFAELACARADRLALVPASLTPQEAALVPISGMTALQAVRAGGVRSGHRVLVLGASGGVGTYVVQLTVALGAQVTGVCSASKVDLVQSLGAARVLDYAIADPTDRRHLDPIDPGYDVIIDIGGNRPVSSLRRVLAARGALVIVGGEGGRWLGGLGRPIGASVLSLVVRQRLVMLISRENAADLLELASLSERGAFRPVLDQTFELGDAAKAIDYVGSGRARGKVAIAVR